MVLALAVMGRFGTHALINRREADPTPENLGTYAAASDEIRPC
jgi:hypothetical protein